MNVDSINLIPLNIVLHVFNSLLRIIIATSIFIYICNSKSKKSHFFIYLTTISTTIIYALLTYTSDIYENDIIFYYIALIFCYYKFSKISLINTIILTIISQCIYYTILIFSLILSFVINIIFPIHSDIINFVIISILHLLLLIIFFNIKKFKNGFTFFKNSSFSPPLDNLLLHISMIILFVYIFIINFNVVLTMQLLPIFILFSTIMGITIYKSFKQYYKQKLVDNEINELRNDVVEKDKMISILKEENLKYSKLNHSIMHKQKSLEFKLNNLIFSTEASNELTNINLDDVITIPLKSTGINKIDDMLKYMQSECVKNNIEFELILNGNINHIINNFISIYDLEILLADLIKNAIIAITNCDNVNKSILLKLGLFDNFYSFCIYDSGCEFEESTLSKLGTEPSTTHSSTGGTGMGFMNTFETLRKINAAITIKEIGIPSKENYTKYILIQFNKDFEFILDSYKKNIAK